MLGATWPSTGVRSRAVSRQNRRWTACPGLSDGRCGALDLYGRFNPAGVERPLPEPTPESSCVCCLDTSYAAADGRRPARGALKRPGDSVPASTTTRSWEGHPQLTLDRCRRPERSKESRHRSASVDPMGAGGSHSDSCWPPSTIVGGPQNAEYSTGSTRGC